MTIGYKILIVDDHPLIADAYKSALSFISLEQKNISFDINFANDCDTAFKKIKDSSSKRNKFYDLVFLDISIPPSEKLRILSGEDIGIKIRDLIPTAKIIISTTFNDNFRMNSIFKSINPDGFLIKNDISPEELVIAIKKVLKEPPYYSKTVTKLLRDSISQTIVLDSIDRELLYELSIGTKMKDLPALLPLSIAGIEKRKRQLKEVFDITEKGDRELVLIAKQKGFI